MNKTITQISLRRAAALLTLMLLTILTVPTEARADVKLKVFTDGVESSTGGSIDFKSGGTKYVKVTPNDNYVIQKVMETYSLGNTFNVNLEEQVIVEQGEAQEYYPISLPSGVTDATVTAYFVSNPLAKVTLIASPASPKPGGRLEFDMPDNPTHLYVYPSTGFYLKSVNLSAGGMATTLDPAPVAMDAENQDPYYEIDITKECTITATFHTWTEDVRVTFDKNGHGTAPAYQDHHLGDKVTKPDDPTENFWNFSGWSKDEDGIELYDFDTELSKDNLKYSQFNDRYNLKLYAIWTKTSGCTVAFDGNGGLGEMTSENQEPETTYTIPECKFTKNDYYFYGWAKSSSGNANFFPGDEITLRKDMTLYAVWIKASGTFGDINWTVSKSTGSDKYDVLTLSGSGEMPSNYVSNYPWYEFRDQLKTIIIEDGVKTIGGNAFRNYTDITTLSIGSGVKTIGCSAFEGLTKVKNLVIPDNVTDIYSSAFKGNTGITTLSIGSGVQKIGTHAFEDLTNVKSLIIPASVTNIGDFAFRGNIGITTLSIGSGVQTIGNDAFSGLKNITSDIILPASLKSIGNYAFQELSAETASGISISAAENCKLNRIDGSFLQVNASIDLSNCTSLTSLKGSSIFNSVTKDITLPSSIKLIGQSLYNNFAGDHIYINVPVGNVLSVDKGVLTDNGKVDLIPYLFDDPTNRSKSKKLSLSTKNELSDWSGKAVEFTRSFTSGVASTLCLPFSFTPASGTCYVFTSVDENWTTVTMTSAAATPLTANIPYLYMPAATGEQTFSGTVTSDAITAGTTTPQDSPWTFTGTYEEKRWDATHHTDEIGRIFGFATGQGYEGKDAVEAAGVFIRLNSGGIKPFRAYLKYTGSLARTRGEGGLPETMTVRLVNANGEIQGIGEIKLDTGEVTFDSRAWYDLNGRRLDGQPSEKGIYINGGRKVVIK